MVTPEEVLYAYRFLLGRDPENDSVVNHWLPVSGWSKLREEFMASKEFGELTEGPALQSQYGYLVADPTRVDVDVSEREFARLLGHVQRAWERLGAERPHWSVLISHDFLPENITANLDRFYASSIDHWRLFEGAAARAGKQPSGDTTAFELGSGVGRMTAKMAKCFRDVVACDISAPHLLLARHHLRGLGIDNVTLLQLQDLGSLRALEPFDFFYSILVLQHNPPPLICRMLEVIFDKLRDGGCAYFQIPVAARQYEFSIESYLERIEAAEVAVEMHILPQKQLFQLLDDCRLRVVDFQIDGCCGPAFQSVSILAEKAPSPVRHG
jgi:SAM-dependent methyltransferase